MGPRGAAGPPGKNGEDVSNPYYVHLKNKDFLCFHTHLV